MPIGRREVVAGCLVAGWLTSIAGAQCRLIPDDEPPSDYGSRVAASGHTALVGSWNGVNIFRFDGAAWPLDQSLPTPDGCSLGCRFGRYVAMDGDVALIGAPDDNIFGPASGSAYIFRHDGTTWAFEQKLVPSQGATSDRFGWSVAIDGEVAIVGAVNAEAAFIFRYDGSTWAEEQMLQGAPPFDDDNFGMAVATTGGIILVGEPDRNSFTGRVYIYEFNGAKWTEEQILTGDAPSEYFGFALSVSGSAVVIGTESADKAWVFRHNGSQWVHQQAFPGGDGNNHFGKAVSIDGNVIVIGAEATPNDSPASNWGAAYIYVYDGLTWVEEDVLVNPGPPGTGGFGQAVATEGDITIVGASNRAYAFGPPEIAFDCNENGNADGCDIENGTSDDINGNGIPDECDLARGDLDLDGTVGVSDLLILLGFWGPCVFCENCLADLDGDCAVGVKDLLILLGNWGPYP